MEKYENDKKDFLQTQRIRQIQYWYKIIRKIKTNLSEIRKASLPPPPFQLNFRHCIYALQYSSFWNHKAKSYGIKTTSYAHKTTSYAFKTYKFDS